MTRLSLEDAVQIIRRRLEDELVRAAELREEYALRPDILAQAQAGLACHVLYMQVSVLDEMKRQQEEVAKTYHETHEAIVEMKRDSRVIKWVTVALVFLTVALGYFAWKLDSMAREPRSVATELRAANGHP